MASAEDAATRPIIDENEEDLPAFRRNGVAHPLATFEPFEDIVGCMPTGVTRTVSTCADIDKYSHIGLN